MIDNLFDCIADLCPCRILLVTKGRRISTWNSHRPTPDGVVHRPDGTTHITSLHRTLKKKEHVAQRAEYVDVYSEFGSI